MAMEEEEDLYAVLRLDDAGPHVVHALIRKAYRKRALELHPDKRGDDPVAAADFQKLQQAYDILNDEKARASYDELQRVRKERVQKEKGQSEKRQKMMRDLAEKEKAFEREQKAKSQEEDVQRRLKAEIARITKARGRQFKGPSSVDQGESANGDARQGASSFDARQQFNEPPKSVPPQSSGGEASDAERTLKVSWTCLDGGAGDYSASRLKEVFEAFGGVEDLVVRSGKSRKKRSALIVMATKQAAVKATETVCGDYWNPLLVVPLLPGTSGQSQEFWAGLRWVDMISDGQLSTLPRGLTSCAISNGVPSNALITEGHWVSKLIKKQHLSSIMRISWHPNNVHRQFRKYRMFSASIKGVDARKDAMTAFDDVMFEKVLCIH